MHKAGFVNLIGLPNVGKSSILNALLGEQLSIVSHKAQTTRQRVLGMINTEEYQLIFSDAPGFVKETAYKMHEMMNHHVMESFEDADVLIFVTDKAQSAEQEQPLVELLQKSNKPIIIAFNKTDISKEAQVKWAQEHWAKLLPDATFMIISALTRYNLDVLVSITANLLPESPPYYDKDIITNRDMRFIAAEIVREQIFLHFEKEIPYSVQTIVEDYEEHADIDRIACTIYVERESQKPIIIGKGGESLTKVGSEARKKLEKFLDKKVFLELRVKVKEKWKNNENLLKGFGLHK
jgi:GTP-binding protein Era